MVFGRWIKYALVVTSLVPSGAGAQRLAEWPVRSSAMPDAITRGAAATFWNPAGLSTGEHRAEALVANLRTSATLDLSGLAGAAALRFERTVLAAAYEHIGINGFTLTEDRPDGTQFDLGEDHFTLAAAHEVSSAFTVGATARYARDNLTDTDVVVGVGAGFITEPKLPLRPLIGAYALSEADAIVWGAAAEARLPPLGGEYHIALAYGVENDGRAAAPIHRAGARFDYQDRISISAGIRREPVRDQQADAYWEPILAASLHLFRYTLGVVREQLADDFGATYTFRLQIGLGP